jgi:ribosome-associated toxin RatA of RatAB toxin-antitoxin module
MPRLSTSITIKASRNTVFQMLRDIENYPNYFQYVRRAKIIQADENTVIAEIDETIHGITQRLQNRFRFFPPDRIEAEQIKGPFKSARAWFLLKEIDDGTELEHIAEFEIGRGVLGKLIHHFIADSYAQDRMAEEVVAIQRAAEQLERVKM